MKTVGVPLCILTSPVAAVSTLREFIVHSPFVGSLSHFINPVIAHYVTLTHNRNCKLVPISYQSLTTVSGTKTSASFITAVSFRMCSRR